MPRPAVFIDGEHGSTGLRIRALLESRPDLDLLSIDVAKRKDSESRRAILQSADFAILCLPDEAAAEAVALIGEASTRVIDTSSARRLDPAWTYGLPELSEDQRHQIVSSSRLANPGCYPQSYLLGVRPLIEAGLVSANVPFTINAVSGYSGGGRQMVEVYQGTPTLENGDAATPLCLYGLDGKHKHLPEMAAFALATYPPLFVPSVDHSVCGMLVSIPIHASHLFGRSAEDIYQVWQARYSREPMLNIYSPAQSKVALRDNKFLDLAARANTNRLDLLVYDSGAAGVVLVGRLDNLGKGAAGNAVQCLNIMLGVDETTGLVDKTGDRKASSPHLRSSVLNV